MQLGEGAARYGMGDKVCALVPGGGYAEYCVVAEDNALPVPPGLFNDRGGGHSGDLFHRVDQCVRPGPPAAGRDLLIHGGASGIGTTAIQLAKAFGANGDCHRGQ